MKAKIGGILVALILALVLYSAMTNNKAEIEQAKQQLENGDTTQTTNAGENQDIGQTEDLEEAPSMIIAETENYLIERVTLDQAITIDTASLDIADYSGDSEIIINGVADDTVETIQVEFSNLSSDFKNDNYTLNTYNKGEGAFRYVASPKFQVLDAGDNVYLITASSKEGESITKITLRTKKDPEKNEPTNTGSIAELSFPKGNFGEAIILDETSAYYSDIKGLEIKKADVSAVSCVVAKAPESEIIPSNDLDENDSEEQKEEATHPITSFLLDTYGTWVYWNTCRPLVTDSLIAFNAIRLTEEEDSYAYEKHYIDYNSGLHGVMELETGTGVTKDNIGEKNNELKEKTYDITEISDSLFKEIIQSNRDEA